MTDDPLPFWERKALAEMTPSEWEALCDGCGKCCLNKLQDPDDGQIVHTDVACKLLDLGSCRCSDYENRRRFVPGCISLTPKAVRELSWLPPTCAYRLLDEGKPLYDWHPLVSGRAESVHEAGVSARGRIISETDVPEEDWEDHIVSWPEDEA